MNTLGVLGDKAQGKPGVDRGLAARINEEVERERLRGPREEPVQEPLVEPQPISSPVNAGDYQIFGPDFFNINLQEMAQARLRIATSAESIAITAKNFDEIRKKVLELNYLQMMPIFKTSEGVYVNVRPGEKEQTLKAYLQGAQKVNGIYLTKREMHLAFAPYETFKTGVQDVEEFVRGGLARAREFTDKEKAEHLAIIVSKEHYPQGVNVKNFEPSEDFPTRVPGLSSCRSVDGRFNVDGGNFGDEWDDEGGCVFGLPRKNMGDKS